MVHKDLGLNVNIPDPELPADPVLDPEEARLAAKPFSVDESPPGYKNCTIQYHCFIIPDPELEDPVLDPEEPRAAPARPFRVDERPEKQDDY